SSARITSIRLAAAGASTNSPSDIENAWAIRNATASVGFAFPRSISDSIDRETPQAADSSSSVHPFFFRSSRTRPQSRRWMGSSFSIKPENNSSIPEFQDTEQEFQ